jgi:hypothetical protein
MQRTPADGLVRRRHGREPADDDLELHRAGSQRLVLRAGRAVRLAFLQRKHGAGLLQEDGVHRLLQCRCAGARHSRSLSSREVGYFIPAITAATDKRCVSVDGKDRCKVAIQTNNVETDERGYVYIVDRANTGLHILELTGDARAAAGLP